jgi:hypothetical protein
MAEQHAPPPAAAPASPPRVPGAPKTLVSHALDAATSLAQSFKPLSKSGGSVARRPGRIAGPGGRSAPWRGAQTSARRRRRRRRRRWTGKPRALLAKA